MRCFGDGDDLYSAYHDHEWAVPVHGDQALYERLSLEGFQAGLSWLTILRKREAFREAFGGFDPAVVASFGPSDVARLLGDAGIVRNRAKINATITNAQAVLALQEAGESLDALIWSYAPVSWNRPRTFADVPASTEVSTALSQELRRRGFRFVGPTTVYATMQSCGLVNDHLQGCAAAA